jgi:beta-phosphoglucomutase-like phosphatase (HAD superfamily)
MLEEFGGLERFYDAWKEFYDYSREKGGLARWRAIQVTLRLLTAVSEAHARQEKERIAELSDEELEASLERGVREFVRENPAVVLLAAQELGWSVEPPEGLVIDE